VDTGCVQENFIQINFEKTFQKLEQFFSRANEHIAEETRWLKENEIDLILSDASSLPLKAGKALGIPSILISNFIWHDIYSHFPGADKYQKILTALREEYAEASMQILPQCHIINDIIENTEEVGFIARKGNNVKNRLEQVSGVSLKDKTIVFIYLGDMGAQSVAWKNLKTLSDIIFITRDPLPKNLPNLFSLPGFDRKLGHRVHQGRVFHAGHGVCARETGALLLPPAFQRVHGDAGLPAPETGGVHHGF